MLVRLLRCSGLFLVMMMASVSSLEGADHYFAVPVDTLEMVEGTLPSRPAKGWTAGVNWQRVEALVPRVVLQAPGESFIQGFEEYWRGSQPRGPAQLLVHTTLDQDVTGWIYWPKTDFSGYQKLKFVLPRSRASTDHRVTFLQARMDKYQKLFRMGGPGAAWYRYQVHQTARELAVEVPRLQNNRRFFGNRGSDLADTYALFSGGRALSENLQLDRQLATTREAEATVALASVEGITIQEFDWEPAIKGLNPRRDVLAAHVPADQHVILFPSFKALVTLADEMGEQGAPLLTLAEPRGETASVRERYERQLGISLDAGVRILGSTMITSVALTGSDPYLRTGADVAVLLETVNPVVVRTFVAAQVKARARSYKVAEAVQGEIAGVSYTGMRSPDRVICSYASTLGQTVIVTNSLAQLRRLIETHQGTRTPLSKLSEYTFFRERYPLGDPRETALMLISDNTIRRWCGPRWRIATSRRTRAAAVMADLQAAQLDALVAGQVRAKPVDNRKRGDLGELSLLDQGVHSTVYGTLDFQTPIVEMEMEQVTPEEARLYERWRDGYQSYWSAFFDPIAVRFQVTESSIATDVTVMPLIDNSDYAPLIGVSKGVELGPDFGDLHPEAILHWSLAINPKSAMLQQNINLLRLLAPQVKVNPLSWIGKGISVFVDQDPFWEDLATSIGKFEGDAEEAFEEFFSTELYRLPVLVHIDVQSGFKLTLFLAGVRAFLESVSPGMLNWEPLEYKGQAYVKVSASPQARNRMSQQQQKLAQQLAFYYVASGEAWIGTLSESLLKRTLDRRFAQDQETNDPQDVPANPAWLGRSMGLQVKKDVLQILQNGWSENYRRNMQRLSWANLEILNEWRKRYPGEDPVALHERFWQRKLICPGGGKYVWNESWQTMESTVFGHPAVPGAGTAFPEQLKRIKFGNFGVTFEESGLRARLELSR